MKGFGTDEAAIINVLCQRAWFQREEINKAFKTEFGRVRSNFTLSSSMTWLIGVRLEGSDQRFEV